MSLEKKEQTYSPLNILSKNSNAFLVSLLVIASFFLGSMWTEVKYLKKQGGSAVAINNGVTPPTQQAPADNGAPVKVSTDNDPVLGDNNAKVTLIEFSDYECPFCKRYFTDTYPQIKKDYIDTGKIKLVFRDLPLSFHQNAPKEAEAAECARKQGGDSTYYKFHDQIFSKTTSNGTGLALDQLPIIAKELGLNVNKFQQCLDSGELKSEVDKDLSDAGKYGASGTPTFFIGKTTNTGSIDGIKIVGAQPYSAFKTVIDELLK